MNEVRHIERRIGGFVELLRRFPIWKLLQMASRFLRRHEKGENVDAELDAIGEELSRKGAGRDIIF